eukprot:ANDGO_02694.mRNA.1 hypothetical protein
MSRVAQSSSFRDVFETGTDASMCCCIPLCLSCYNSNEDSQAIIENFTGRTLKDGPTWFCIPCCPPVFKVKVFKKIVLDSSQFVEVRDWASNDITIIPGPAKVQLKSPYDRISPVRSKVSVPLHHYIRIQNQDGSIEHIVGPVLFVPKPYQIVDMDVRPSPLVQANQYCWMFNRESQTYRKIVGPCSFIPLPQEDFISLGLNGLPSSSPTICILQAYEVNKVQSLHVRNVTTGDIRMLSEPQRFVPNLDELSSRSFRSRHWKRMNCASCSTRLQASGLSRDMTILRPGPFSWVRLTSCWSSSLRLEL